MTWATLPASQASKPTMDEPFVSRGGQGSIEFDDSAEANSVESRLSLVRSLVEDVAHSGESSFSQEITIDDRIWQISVQQRQG